jgi:hypothetical protein
MQVPCLVTLRPTCNLLSSVHDVSKNSEKAGMSLPPAARWVEIRVLKQRMISTLAEIRGKNSAMTVQDLKRLLFRCAATLISLEIVSIVSFVHYWMKILHHLVRTRTASLPGSRTFRSFNSIRNIRRDRSVDMGHCGETRK